MATDLFKEYYNNPTKSYIYANLLCNTSSADEMTFDINGSEAQISDNDNVLSSVDLSDVNVGLSQYTTDMKIIEPYSFVYVKGMVFGETFASKTFGRILGELTEGEHWMENGVLFFVVKYMDASTGQRVVRSVKCSGDLDGEKTFIDSANEFFEEKSIYIDASYNDGWVTFTSTEAGYDFWIDHVMFWTIENDDHIIDKINQWMVDNGHEIDFGWEDDYLNANGIDPSSPYLHRNVYSSVIAKSGYTRLYNLLKCLDTDFNDILQEDDVKKIWLFEDLTKRISPRKYRNGAMKGLLLKATYPQFNADDIYEYQRSLKVAHLKDSVEEWYMIPESVIKGTCIAARKIVDVCDSYCSEYDTNSYNRWMGRYTRPMGGDNWIDCDEVPHVVPEMFGMWEAAHVPYIEQGASIYRDMEERDVMGLQGYCAYCSKHGLWQSMGQMYALTSIPDDEDPYCKNLIPSFVIYNPNPFPVKVNYITFG